MDKMFVGQDLLYKRESYSSSPMHWENNSKSNYDLMSDMFVMIWIVWDDLWLSSRHDSCISPTWMLLCYSHLLDSAFLIDTCYITCLVCSLKLSSTVQLQVFRHILCAVRFLFFMFSVNLKTHTILFFYYVYPMIVKLWLPLMILYRCNGERRRWSSRTCCHGHESKVLI